MHTPHPGDHCSLILTFACFSLFYSSILKFFSNYDGFYYHLPWHSPRLYFLINFTSSCYIYDRIDIFISFAISFCLSRKVQHKNGCCRFQVPRYCPAQAAKSAILVHPLLFFQHHDPSRQTGSCSQLQFLIPHPFLSRCSARYLVRSADDRKFTPGNPVQDCQSITGNRKFWLENGTDCYLISS